MIIHQTALFSKHRWLLTLDLNEVTHIQLQYQALPPPSPFLFHCSWGRYYPSDDTARRETVWIKFLFWMRGKVIIHVWNFKISTYNTHAHMGYIIQFISKESLEISEKLRKLCTARRAVAQLCVQSPGSNSRTSGQLMVRVGIVLYSRSCLALGRAFSLTNLPIALWKKPWAHETLNRQ